MHQYDYDYEDRRTGYGGAIVLGICLFLILWETWVVLRFGFRIGRAALRITPWPNLNGCIASCLAITMACSTCITASLVWIMLPSLNIFHWLDRTATTLFAGWVLVNAFVIAPLLLMRLLFRIGIWLFQRDYSHHLVSYTERFRQIFYTMNNQMEATSNGRSY